MNESQAAIARAAADGLPLDALISIARGGKRGLDALLSGSNLLGILGAALG